MVNIHNVGPSGLELETPGLEFLLVGTPSPHHDTTITVCNGENTVLMVICSDWFSTHMHISYFRQFKRTSFFLSSNMSFDNGTSNIFSLFARFEHKWMFRLQTTPGLSCGSWLLYNFSSSCHFRRVPESPNDLKLCHTLQNIALNSAFFWGCLKSSDHLDCIKG